MDGIEMFKQFVQLHRQQLITSGIPELYWKMLYRKLTNQIFDAGNSFSLYLIDYSDGEREPEDPIWTVGVSKEDGIKHLNPDEIYIIDHAWTFRLNTTRRQLNQIDDLRNRMAMIMGVDQENQSLDDCVEEILKNLWKYCQMYSIQSDSIVSVEDRMPIWYVMDEFGCGINNSDTPNVRTVPFMFMGDQTTYSVLFPLEDVANGEYISRDYVEGVVGKSEDDENLRKALLLPWKQCDFTELSYEQIEPNREYFLSGRIEETLPIVTAAVSEQQDERASLPLKVYATYRYVNEYLTDSNFILVDNEQEADILWLTDHFKKYAEFSEHAPTKFINQFPFENVLTIKDLLCVISRRMTNKHSDEKTLETFPTWLPTTYNLKTELLEFISYYQLRAKNNLDNHWIVKPFNLARSIDTHITNNLSQIVRLQPTGPKIVQKYIEKPILFYRSELNGNVKFDVRYVILLKSIEPLTAYVYKNFFLRFANKPFALNHFDDYEQHFTVMNYTPEIQMRHIPCAEFLELWKEQYPLDDWINIENDIIEMLKEMLLGATALKPPSGIGNSVQSRALYAVDLMLERGNENCGENNSNNIKPKLLEVNFMPDNKRACEYYPEFYNDVFKLLFLNDFNENVFRKIVG